MQCVALRSVTESEQKQRELFIITHIGGLDVHSLNDINLPAVCEKGSSESHVYKSPRKDKATHLANPGHYSTMLAMSRNPTAF